MGTHERPKIESIGKDLWEPIMETKPGVRNGGGLKKSRSHREEGHVAKGKTEDVGIVKGRKSLPHIEMINAAFVAASVGVKLMAADMPEFMQVHAFQCARRTFDSLEKFSTKQMAHDIKKEFDKVYGPTWHCIIGTNFGSFVTHSTGCFIYFSMEKIFVMVFKTRIPRVLLS